MRKISPQLDRWDALFSMVLFAGAFALYIRTLAPSLLAGDSAEFQTIAYTLGVGHPTGYSVYILLAKLFTLIPVGEIAYRVNLFSAFCAALTVGLTYLTLRKFTVIPVSAAYGSLALALTPLFWKHASIAEIYTAGAACLAFILLALFQWEETNNPWWLFTAGLCGGLSLGIHTTVALAAPAALIYLGFSFFLSPSTINKRKRDFLSGFFGAVLGVLLFFSSFLFLDSLNSSAGYYNIIQPSLSIWDMTPADFNSPFERFAFLYFPPQFKGMFFSVSLEDAIDRLADFAADALWSLPFAFLGLVSIFIPRRDSPSHWRKAVLLSVAFVAFLLFAATYKVFDFYVFYIPAILILVIFIGLGVDAIFETVDLIPKLPPAFPALLGLVVIVASFYFSFEGIASSWKERIPPRTEEWESRFYKFPNTRQLEVEEIVNDLEDNAILFTYWDYTYDYYYVAHVLQGRVEMDFHETYPQDDMPRFADSAVEYIEANIDSRPIYFSERLFSLMTKFKVTRVDSGLFRIERK